MSLKTGPAVLPELPRLRLALLFALVAGWTSSAPVRGQGVGGPSLASDYVPLSRTIPERQEVKDDMDRARFHLGPIRILPSVSMWDTGYDSNVYGSPTNPVGDWTFTVNAGARFFVPFGSKFVFRAIAFPQYTWYNELSDRNKFGGVYNASLFGFFNHVTTEFAGGYSSQYIRYSSEVDSLVFETSKTATGRLEFDLSSHWSLFGSGVYQEVQYRQIQGPPLQDIGVVLNDRTSTAGRGGVRYRISPDWNVAVAAEGTFADFQITPELRNNTSNAYLGSIEYRRPRLFLNLIAGYREGTGSDSDFFPNYSTGVGSFFASFFPLPWLEIQGYGQRGVIYSITLENPYFFDSRLGGKVNIQIGERFLVSGYGQAGPNTYPRAQLVQGELVKRRDDTEQYGGGISVLLWRPLVVSGRATRTVVDSNIPGESRAYTRYTAYLTFTGVFER